MSVDGSGEPQGPSLIQLYSILRAYWRISLGVFLVVLCVSAVVATFLPKSYKATATLMVNYEGNDPLAEKELPVSLLGTYMATQTELMGSSEILDTVIDRLNLAADPFFASGNRGGATTLHEWIDAQLRKNLDIEQGHGSQLINITAYARDPNTAANIANEIGKVYMERHSKEVSGPATERAKRYTEELADLKQKVAVAQDTLTKLRQRTGQIESDGKNDVESDNLSDLERRLGEAQAVLRAAQARALADPGAGKEISSSELIRTYRSEAAKLSSKMAQLRTMYGVEHPQVVELQSQIDANAHALADAIQGYATAANADVTAARQGVEQLQAAVAAQRQKVLAGRQMRDEASKYQLELESAASVYKRALEGYDQIMFASNGQDSNVSLVSEARPPAESEKRKTLLIFLIGAAGGLALAVGGPLVFEFFHRRIRCRDDVERELGVPVLVEFAGMSFPASVS